MWVKATGESGFFPNILYYDNSEEGNCLEGKKKNLFQFKIY